MQNGLISSGPRRSQRYLRTGLNKWPQLPRPIRVPHYMMNTLHITQINHGIKREPTQLRPSIRDVIEFPKPRDSSDSEIYRLFDPFLTI